VNDPLRVLMVSDVSPSHPAGGGERMLWEQARRLAARGHDVRVASRVEPDATAPASYEREGVRVREFPVSRRSIGRFIASSILGARRTTVDELARQPADVLHLHQPLAGYGALASRAGRRLPGLYSFYSPAPLEYRSRRGMTARHRAGLAGATGTAILWAFERACLRRVALVHVLSDFAATQVWKLYAVPKERIVKIPGAAATERFQPAADRGAVRRALGIMPDRPLLFTVRNLESRMGLDNLLRAMSIVKSWRLDARLLIGGDGSLRKVLEAQSRELGLAEHVTFLGFVPDAELPRYYQAADVFVLPTRELEGFGLVTVEALACGTPVLGTPIGATPEILRPLCASLVFDGTSPEAMAERLGRFLADKTRDPESYERLRNACRAHCERHYAWARATTDLERALRHVAARRADAPERCADAPERRAGAPETQADAPARRAEGPEGPTESGPAPVCPACGEPTRPSELVYRGVRHRRCGSCGSSLATVLPTALELQRQYETDYPRRFAPERLTTERAGLFCALLDRLAALGLGSLDRPRLLDVGGGGGHLAALGRARRWATVSADLAHSACAAAPGDVPTVQADGTRLPFRGGTVDAVTLVNVLDQASDPASILREAHRVLVAGGLLALRVPNARFHRAWVRLLISLGPLARSREWDTYPIVHHFAFTPAGLRRLAERTGFRVLEVGNSAVASRALGRVVIAAGAAALASFSRDRCLVGPSVELFARKGPG
jgi:glycosyltransferase involved in cell wall biosynthesis/SAM-dependent methyltransferase